jgi:hypothetical protein
VVEQGPARKPQPRDEQVADTPQQHTHVDVKPGRKAEQKAFMAFLTKRDARNWRDFTFEHHDADVAEAANRLGAAGDVDAVKALFALAEAS